MHTFVYCATYIAKTLKCMFVVSLCENVWHCIIITVFIYVA